VEITLYSILQIPILPILPTFKHIPTQNTTAMAHTPGLVLIHGAGLNSAIWEEIEKEIGLDVLAVDFPNRNNGDANKHLTFHDYLNSTVAQIKNAKFDRFILATQSIGACVGLAITAPFRDRIAAFVAIGSVVPPGGQSFAGAMPFPLSAILPIILRLFGTKPPVKSIEDELCSDLTPEQTQKIIAGFTPEARALYTTRIRYELPDTKRIYIKLTSDKSIPPSVQDKMAQNLHAHTIMTIDSGHLPMLSQPKQLASILTSIADESRTDENVTDR